MWSFRDVLDLAQECLTKGGERAQTILAFLRFVEREVVTDPLHHWRDSLFDEPEPIRLGALWAYGSSSGRKPRLDPAEVLSLINGLKTPFRSLALAYLSAQIKSLPVQLQDFLRELEDAESEDGNAVQLGKEKRDSIKGNNP